MIPRPETEAKLYSEAEERILQKRRKEEALLSTSPSSETPLTESDSERGPDHGGIEIVALSDDEEGEASRRNCTEGEEPLVVDEIRESETNNGTSFASSNYDDSSSDDDDSSADERAEEEEEEGLEILPRRSPAFAADEEGLEVVATGRLQSIQMEELDLLRSKSLDSVLFHRRESQDISHCDDSDGEDTLRASCSEMKRVQSEVAKSSSSVFTTMS